MSDPESLDDHFRDAVAAIDAGDLVALRAIIEAHPEILAARLETPGPWLRDQVGGAVDGFFSRPYLLWFVAEDPARKGRLPAQTGTIRVR
jgi:hypothetical protein